jgi:short-subunit dehydrogenase
MDTIKTNKKSKALVTGFSSGIGLAYSKYLALNNWELELVAQNPEKSEMAFNAIKYKNSTYHLADLSKPEGVEEITKKVKNPDLIIANAGITMFGGAGSIDKGDRKDLFYLLCNGVIDLIEAYIPNMIKMGKGRIVIISSIGAITPMPKSSIYASAKSAIYSYGQSLSQELSSKNISVTVSLPGYVKTEAHARAGLDHLREKIPSWMWLDAEKVVAETEEASLKRKSTVIPGKVYKLVRPFLGMSLASSLWNKITKRSNKR